MIKWCSRWKINFNLDKCYFLNFSLKRKNSIEFMYKMFDYRYQLPRVYEIKDLGVIFTYNMSFNKHICNVTAKSFHMLGFIRNTMKPLKIYDLMKIYLCYVHCIIVLYVLN